MRKAQQASRHPRAACCALLVWRPGPQGDAACTTATPVCRLAARPGPFCRARRAVRARRMAVGLPVVVCCCHLRHCGPTQLAAFCPGPSSALFPKWRPAGALARGIAARCGPLAMPGKGWRRFLGHVAKALRPSALAASAGFTSASALLPACSREPCLGAASPPQAMWQQVCAAAQPGWRPWRGERLPQGGFRRQRPPGSKTYMEHIVVGHYELFCIE